MAEDGGKQVSAEGAGRVWQRALARAVPGGRLAELGLSALILAQLGCALFFLWDVWQDSASFGGLRFWDAHLRAEAVASIVLFVGIWLSARILLAMRAEAQALRRSLEVASGALADVIEEHFQRWGLTPSERDVAFFAIKGLSIAEIAALRGSREGTVKTQLNAVYRKAGVRGRAELASLFIEDLMADGLPTGAARPARD